MHLGSGGGCFTLRIGYYWLVAKAMECGNSGHRIWLRFPASLVILFIHVCEGVGVNFIVRWVLNLSFWELVLATLLMTHVTISSVTYFPAPCPSASRTQFTQ